MNREILFRGKSIEPSTEGKWVFGSLTMDCHGNCWICHPLKVPMVGGFQYFNVDTKTVGQLWMQIVNLKIFEGDVFEFPKHNVRFVVKYNEKRHQFCIAHPDELGSKYLNPWQCPDESWIEEFMKDAVLIGNIYDNKELLK